MQFQQIKKYILLFLLFISVKCVFAQIELPDDFFEIVVSSGWDAPLGFEVDETQKCCATPYSETQHFH